MLPSNVFKRSEFACRCRCGKDTVDAELLQVLHVVRHFYNAPVTITSGHRCEKHNKSVGGAGGSMHLVGKAADIIVEGVEPQDVYEYLCDQYPHCYGIGNYKRWTHIDVRPNKARW